MARDLQMEACHRERERKKKRKYPELNILPCAHTAVHTKNTHIHTHILAQNTANAAVGNSRMHPHSTHTGDWAGCNLIFFLDLREHFYLCTWIF
jgi:hypothetical protein